MVFECGQEVRIHLETTRVVDLFLNIIFFSHRVVLDVVDFLVNEPIDFDTFNLSFFLKLSLLPFCLFLTVTV